MTEKTEKIIPRCPMCKKRVGNWLEGTASYTCRFCNTEFIIGQGFITILTHLTKPENRARVESKA